MRSEAFAVLTVAMSSSLVPPTPAEAQRGGGQTVQLPTGAGQELVQKQLHTVPWTQPDSQLTGIR